jgi:DNA-binding CsgD family transcriptional regulator
VQPALSSRESAALRRVHDALLEPLAYDTTEEWLFEVADRFKTLCHGHTSLVGYAFPGEPACWISRDLAPKYLDRIGEIMSPVPGTLTTIDPAVERLVRGPRLHNSGVAGSADFLDSGVRIDDLQESPVFRDIAFPLGVPGSTFLFHSGASGEFAVQTSFPQIPHRPFGPATGQILSPLLPALAAGAASVVRLGRARQALMTVLDVLEDGATVFDAAGRRVLAKNQAMCLLGRTEPKRADLERTIAEAAIAAAWPLAAPKTSSEDSSHQPPSRGWRSASGFAYRIRAVRLPDGSWGTREAVLVLVERVGTAVPPPGELTVLFGFTLREAEVAYRLAYGHSNRKIAADLGLSPHTVRHHTESIFLKAGISSRKALALHLSSASKPPLL